MIKEDSEVESSFIQSWEPVQAGVLDFRADLHYSGTVWPSWCTYVHRFFSFVGKKKASSMPFLSILISTICQTQI